MIVTKLAGGLGNQLFAYAAGRYLAYKHNTELKIEKESLEAQKHPLTYYQLGVFNIQENFASKEEVAKLKLIKEEQFIHFIPEILDSPDDIVLDGCWQSWKYFSPIENILHNEITLKNPLSPICKG